MAVIEIAKIQVRRGQENQTGIPQLDSGEFGWAEDTENLYIGKRIVDGAVDDENTRILTENDLNFFNTLSQNTGTINAYYKYRDDVTVLTHTTGTTVKVKLDHLPPGLADFGVIPSSTATDITALFQNAINDLFYNDDIIDKSSAQQADLRRTLLIPAGNYYIDGAINIPPYTRIVGEGPGITTLIQLNTTTHMFKTLDLLGVGFENPMSSIGTQRAREVYIEGMTLAYSSATDSTYALLSLDNVLNATVRDVHFKTYSTSTNGGVGIQIRGSGDGTLDIPRCENVQIEHCSFEYLNTAVLTTGSVIRAIVENSMFDNLAYGVVFDTVGSTPSPTDCIIAQNRFQNILNEGILVNESVAPTNHISSYNSFLLVGNGGELTDFNTTTTNKTPVISFLSSGNRTVGDHFNRKAVADSTSSLTFVYNPLIAGSTIINDTRTYNTRLEPGASNVVIAKVPLNGTDQALRINYQMTSLGLSRKGNLLVNIASDGYATFSDYYNYSEYIATVGPVFSIPSYPELVSDNQSVGGVNQLVLEKSYADATLNFDSVVPVSYSIIGKDNQYQDSAAVITAINTEYNDTTNQTYYVIATESSNPAFDFSTSTTATFQLGYNDSINGRDLTNFDFPFNTSTIVRNFVEMVLTNPSLSTSTNVEYQIDTQL